MSSSDLLRIAIDAPVKPGACGGVAQMIMGLIHALGQLDDGPEEYLVVVNTPEQYNWLEPHIGPNQELLLRPQTIKGKTRSSIKRLAGPLLPALRYVRRRIRESSGTWPEISLSDGFYESLGCDVIHFPHQNYVLCALPSVYNPHDLQHLHYPRFFTVRQLAERETYYPAGCHYSHTVVVNSQWIKDDLVRQYGLSPGKVQVVPLGPPSQVYSRPSENDLSAVQEKYRLRQPFALYPAVTWPHKNHLRLLEALAHLRDQKGLEIRLVCPGALYEPFWPEIKQRLDQLDLGPQVKFLGFVPEKDLRSIYGLAQFLVMPTLFESNSLPVYEAWLEGLPVVCSRVTSLPEQIMDAGVLFDPQDAVSIAEAMAGVAADAGLQEKLRTLGSRRLEDFDWERTARAYRAVYRRAAARRLTEEDLLLLGWDWMKNPRK